jgi:hypothetical protein
LTGTIGCATVGIGGSRSESPLMILNIPSTYQIVGLAVGVIAAASPVRADLGTAKNLYESAAYEEALSALETVDPADSAEQVDQYRALCLIALGRVQEAERSVDQIVARNPLYRLPEQPEQEASPRLIALFRDARRRVLPGAAKAQYASAKASFDARKFADAAEQFKELLALASMPDLDQQAFSDLKQLAEGFLRLSEASLPPPSGTGPNATAMSAAASAAPGTAAVFTDNQHDVVAPVEVDRSMPRYAPPAVVAGRTLRGTLVVVIGESGDVESATLVRPIASFYDAALLEAARHWRYTPASRSGSPVKFRKVYEIVLKPPS